MSSPMTPRPTDPQITLASGMKVAITSYDLSGFVDVFRVGIVTCLPGQDWIAYQSLYENANGGAGIMSDINAKGGWTAWLLSLWNYAKTLLGSFDTGNTAPPSTDPTTDAQAMAAIPGVLAGKKLVIVNGVLTLQ